MNADELNLLKHQNDIIRDALIAMEGVKQKGWIAHTAFGDQHLSEGWIITNITITRCWINISAYAAERARQQDDCVKNGDLFSVRYLLKEKRITADRHDMFMPRGKYRKRATMS